MVETVLILPFVMIVIVLLIYLGWNFRRLALVTNMDRYVVWDQVTPGAPGPGLQRLSTEVRNPRLNNAFFGLNNDNGLVLEEYRLNDGYQPEAHEDLLQQQADETYSYFDAFIDSNPAGIRERMVARHDHLTDSLQQMGMADEMRNRFGHRRLNGDWRYANGVRYADDEVGWMAGGYRVSPARGLIDVFFAQIDDTLEGYDDNEIARASRNLYTSYPAYHGPRVRDETHND